MSSVRGELYDSTKERLSVLDTARRKKALLCKAPRCKAVIDFTKSAWDVNTLLKACTSSILIKADTLAQKETATVELGNGFLKGDGRQWCRISRPPDQSAKCQMVKPFFVPLEVFASFLSHKLKPYQCKMKCRLLFWRMRCSKAMMVALLLVLAQ